MPVQRCVAPEMDRLHEVLRSYRELPEVYLRLSDGCRTTLVKPDDKLRVKQCPTRLADLKQFPGLACVSCGRFLPIVLLMIMGSSSLFSPSGPRHHQSPQLWAAGASSS